MRRRCFLALTCLLSVALAGGSQKKKNEEPKTQVLPLPRELPMAVIADTASLDFHISPLLKTGKLSAQIRESLNALIRDTRGETIVKLRAFVAGAGDARRVQMAVSELFTDRRLPLPALTIIQVGALGDDAAQVVVEAVVGTKKTLNPHGLAFVSGQSGSSFRASLERLKSSLNLASVSPENVLSTTCFTSRVVEYESMRQAVEHAFAHSQINLVQALRDPADEATTCEAVGQLSKDPEPSGVVLLQKARASLVNAPQLIFTGLQLTFGDFLDDAHEAYSRLQRAAGALSPVETPLRVNAFSLDQSTASALRKTMQIPSGTLTVQSIEGLAAVDASAGVEAILAANVGKPAER